MPNYCLRETSMCVRVPVSPVVVLSVDHRPAAKFIKCFHLKLSVNATIARTTAYRHTNIYCGYPPRCFRCGTDHKTPECPNKRMDLPRCALGQGNLQKLFRIQGPSACQKTKHKK